MSILSLIRDIRDIRDILFIQNKKKKITHDMSPTRFKKNPTKYQL